jgi:hypothetical protein
MTATDTAPVDIPAVPDGTDGAESVDERQPLAELFQDLGTSPSGLSERETARRRLLGSFLAREAASAIPDQGGAE